MKKLFSLFLPILFPISLFSQMLFYNDTFNGGITSGGYSPDYSSGGTGTFDIYVEPGSTIYKAFLFAGRHGTAGSLTVTMNGNSLTFNNANGVSPIFQSINYGGNSQVHAIDVTSILDPTDTTYILDVPYQSGPSDRYNDFYLFVAYQNSNLSPVSVSIFLNDFDLQGSVTWSLSPLQPLNSSSDVGISIFAGYICDFISDGEIVTVNGNNIGIIGSPDYNSGPCGGPIGNCYYQNGALIGLHDNEDLAVNEADALSNIKDLVSTGDTSVTIKFDHQTVANDNAIWAVVVASSGNMSLPSLFSSDTSICEKFCIDFYDSSANNPTSWQWIFDGATPPGSTDQNPTGICYDTPGSYDVTLITTNANGSDTLILADYITVYDTPPFPTISQNGNTLTASPADSYQWQFNSIDVTGATNQNYEATQSGLYTVIITDSNGCTNSATIDVVFTGMENLSLASNLFIYPNPSNGNFVIELLSELKGEEISVEIFNAIGQLVFSYQERFDNSPYKKEIDLSPQATGVYLIRLKTETDFINQKMIFTER
ncbi:MAG: T9SS type A sorting domain-containing protein [Chitinophagales bacterium]|nr:T9SS type A sorting domain-containing protein [Chitinophagales bacterium]